MKQTKRQRRVLWTPGYRMSEIEFDDEEPKKRHRGTSHRGKGSVKRHRAKKNERKQAFKKKLKELATLVAFDLLEMRVEAFQENEKTWREQQTREAKAYAEKLAVVFREAVKKAAAA